MTTAFALVSPGGRRTWDDARGWMPLLLGRGEVVEALDACYGLNGAHLQRLASGLLNDIWVCEAAGAQWVIRVSRESRTRAEVEYEQRVCARLAERLPFVHSAVAGADGATVQEWRGRPLCLWPRISGRHLRTRDAHYLRHRATALAEIHRASTALLADFGPRPGSRQGDHWWAWPIVRPVLDQHRSSLGMDPGEVEGLFQLFDMTTTELQALIAAVEKSGPLAGIIHGDFNDRNLLVQDGRLTAVVDWDDCGFGWLMTDVAIAMPAPTARLARVRQFVDLYVEAGGPLEAPSIDMLLQLKRCSTLNEVFWTVDDVDGAWLLHPRSATILREVALDLRRLESARRRLEHRGLARTSAGP